MLGQPTSSGFIQEAMPQATSSQITLVHSPSLPNAQTFWVNKRWIHSLNASAKKITNKQTKTKNNKQTKNKQTIKTKKQTTKLTIKQTTNKQKTKKKQINKNKSERFF